MDWLALQDRMPRDRALPERCFRLSALESVLDGRHYDVLRYPFSAERNGAGEYVPLDERRPSVRSNLCRVVVEDSVSLLFSEGHWPTIQVSDARTATALETICQASALKQTMLEAATRGSVGSVVVLMRVVDGRIFFDVLRTAYLTPVWSSSDPRELSELIERYRVKAEDLLAQGHAVEPGGDYWFERHWDDRVETWYLPYRDGADRKIDVERSGEHGLGFVPAVWIRNLPASCDMREGPDGGCTFQAAIDTVIETDYLLSQAGRGLKYGSDPTLVLKDPGLGIPQGSTAHVGGASNALMLPPEGDAKLLEINGNAAAAVLAHVQQLRAIALEAMHGNRAQSDRLGAAQSGRAIELMCQGLIWLADRLRISYGEYGLVSLLRKICLASRRLEGGLVVGDAHVTDLDDAGLSLSWPDWFPMGPQDRQAQADALGRLVEGGIMTQAAAERIIGRSYGISVMLGGGT